MQDDELVRAGVFGNDVEARFAISVLADNGIVAQIDDGGGMFDLGIGGEPTEVQIIVKASDFARSQELIAEIESNEGEPCPAWTCKCGEDVDEGFFACWSCGAEYQS